jgi:hypothetical protein
MQVSGGRIVSNFVVGILVYVGVFVDGGLVATGHWAMAILVLVAIMYLPYTSKLYVDVKAARDSEDRT